MGVNPMQQVMAALQARSAGPGGGAPGAGPGAPGAGGPDAGGGDAYAAQVADLRGADPGMLLAQLKKMKQIFAVMMVQNLERLPNVAGKVAKIIPAIDGVIKEVQQAASVNSAVRPIQMGAAQPPNLDQNPQPGPGMF